MEDIVKKQENKAPKSITAESLIREHWNILWKFCLKLTFNTQRAQELFEEVLFRIVKYFNTYDHNKSFLQWVYSITINALKTAGKNSITKNYIYIKEGMEENLKDTSQNNTFVNKEYLREKIANCLAMLKPIERMIFCMKYFDDKKLDEIAEALQLNSNTTRVYFIRAKEKMRKFLGGWLYEM